MTNLLTLLVIGASIGWLITALRRPTGTAAMLANLIAGTAASFAAGLGFNGQGLYAGLSAAGYAGAVSGAFAALGLLALVRRLRPH